MSDDLVVRQPSTSRNTPAACARIVELTDRRLLSESPIHFSALGRQAWSRGECTARWITKAARDSLTAGRQAPT